MTDSPLIRDRQAAAKQAAEQLNGGWPFGPGPDQWNWYIDYRDETETGSQPAGPHVCCSWCQQSITRAGRFSLTLESLKPQIALHVMQVHPDAMTR